MPKVNFQSASFPLEQYESVLDCLLRNGKHIPYACKAGMCQACLVKSRGDRPPDEAGKWVRQSLREKNYCLACQWVPQGDVDVALPSVEEFAVALSLNEMTMLNDQVMSVKLKPVEPGTLFHYHPGQYLTLINPEGTARSYSIANDFEQDGFVELQISNTSHGIFTHWLFNDAAAGDVLHARGPSGDCFYTTPEHSEPFPLILAATGTGLAPLLGIVGDALERGHQGPVTLYHGGRSPAALYCVDRLQALAKDHAEFSYIPVCRELDDTAPDNCLEGDLAAVVSENVDPACLPGAQVYLCGNPDFVHRLRKLLFLKGARSSAIFCDPFLERTVPENSAV